MAANTRSSARRRQRSVRVTVAVTLLAVGTIAVLATLPTQSPVLLSVSSVVGLLLAWAALRMMWTEVLQSRRENAADRAAAATAYRELFAQRAAEHAEFTTTMTERLAESTTSVRELQASLVAAQRRLADVTVRADSSETERDEARARVTALEAELSELRDAHEEAVAHSGPAAELATWDAKAAEIAAEHSAVENAAIEGAAKRA